MDAEQIQLILDMGASGANVEAVRAKLDELKGSAQKTADTYEVLEHGDKRLAIAAREAAEAARQMAIPLDEDVKALTASSAAALKAAEATQTVTTAMVRQTNEAAMAAKAHYELASGTTALRGDYSRSGGGLLGVSFAAQDFVSVLSGGGGLGRALNAVSNNIPQILLGLGMGAGLAGGISVVTALVGAGIPVIESFFGGFSGKAKDEALDGMKQIEAEIKRVEHAYKELRDQATPEETEEAKRLKDFLGQRPNAEKVRRAYIQANASGAPDIGMMNEAERASLEEYDLAIRDAEKRRARGEKPTLQQENEEQGARRRRALLMDEANKRRADQEIADAVKGGPAGEPARQRLVEALKQQAPDLAANIEHPPPTVKEVEAQEKKRMEAEHQVQERIKRDIERKNKALQADADERLRRDHIVERERAQAQREKEKEEKDREREAEKNRKDREQRAEKERREGVQAAGKTDMDERAVVEAALMRQQGGVFDQRGRFHELNPDQQTGQLKAMIDRELRARFPGMSGQARTAVADEMGNKARQAVDDRLNEAQFAAAQQGLDANRETLAAMQRLVMEFTVLAQQAQAQAHHARALGQQQRAARPRAERGPKLPPKPAQAKLPVRRPAKPKGLRSVPPVPAEVPAPAVPPTPAPESPPRPEPAPRQMPEPVPEPPPPPVSLPSLRTQPTPAMPSQRADTPGPAVPPTSPPESPPQPESVPQRPAASPMPAPAMPSQRADTPGPTVPPMPSPSPRPMPLPEPRPRPAQPQAPAMARQPSDSPQIAQLNQTMLQSQGQMASTQQIFATQLAEARRILAASQQINQRARQSGATAGLP